MREIWYVEDDETIAEAVREYLEQKDCRVTVFSLIADAKRSLRGQCPDLMLIDWNLPDGSGEDFCGWIRSVRRELPVMFLTVREDACDIVAGLRKGADDYIVKPFALEVLHARILALLRRSSQPEEARLFCGDLILDKERQAVFYRQEEIALSQPEYKLLQLLMENQGRTLTRAALLDRIWDQEGNYVNDNTLTVTMKRLREKLNHPACIKTIRSFGYRMEESYEK